MSSEMISETGLTSPAEGVYPGSWATRTQIESKRQNAVSESFRSDFIEVKVVGAGFSGLRQAQQEKSVRGFLQFGGQSVFTDRNQDAMVARR
jgi:hypothetical protein